MHVENIQHPPRCLQNIILGVVPQKEMIASKKGPKKGALVKCIDTDSRQGGTQYNSVPVSQCVIVTFLVGDLL